MEFLRRVRWAFVLVTLMTALLVGASSALFGTCGPFTDVAADAFCPFVLEIFYLGITTGTTPTTYDPGTAVTRLQMAAFLSRTVDGVLKRGSRKAVTEKFWSPQNSTVLALTTVGSMPSMVKFDGVDLWVANSTSANVSRVRAGDGKLLETWTGASNVFGVLVAFGRILMTAPTTPGKLYMIDPGQPAGAVTTVATNVGNNTYGIAFDGARVWTANAGGSVSIVTPAAAPPWPVATVLTGFFQPVGGIYDGSNVWITDETPGTLLKLDATGAILQTVTVESAPGFPVFDGANIWVPNVGSDSVSVVRASTGAVLQTLTGNGLDVPISGAFDGERVLFTNNGGNSVSLWKAANLAPLGVVSTGSATAPHGAASDGVNFWITLRSAGKLARF